MCGADRRTPASGREHGLHLRVWGWGCPNSFPGLATAPPSAPHTLPLQLNSSTAEARPSVCPFKPVVPLGLLSRVHSGDWARCPASVPPPNYIHLRNGAHVHFHSAALSHNSTHFVVVFSWRNLESVAWTWTSIPRLLPGLARPIPRRGSWAAAPFVGALHGPALDSRQLDPV